MKAAPGDQDVLVALDPDVLFVPPYVGHKGWVGIHLDGRRLDWALLTRLVRESYRLIAPKKLREAGG